MEMKEIYLDNSATTKVYPEVAELMKKVMLEDYGNPSSLHTKGVDAEEHIKTAKKQIAKILKCQEKEILFTSCGTEGDNLAILGTAMAHHRRGKHLITTKIEHPAVLEPMAALEKQGFEVTYLDVDADGHIDLQQLSDAIRPDTILVSIMHTNNEMGALEPIEEAGKIIKEKNPQCYFHVDAVQGFGKAEIKPKKMNIDMLSVSGHKIHAPKGVGFLYINEKVRLQPLMLGGGQQGGMRSGTEATPLVAAIGLASEMCYENLEEKRAKMYAMRDRFVTKLEALDGVYVRGKRGTETAPHIVSASFEDVRAEVLLHSLEAKGIYVSSGSACASNHPATSKTLLATGTDKKFLDATIRFSFSDFTTDEELDTTIAALEELLPQLRRFTRK